MDKATIRRIKALPSGLRAERTRGNLEVSKRVEIMSFTVSGQERATIQASAKALGLTISELVRISVFERLKGHVNKQK